MREFKFRAWDKKEKRFIFQKDVLESYIPVKQIPAGFELKSKFVLMQYTGLKDKNGKEIYEGDFIDGGGFGPVLIKFGKYDNEESYEDRETGLGFYLESKDDDIFGGDALWVLFEEPVVIGNIYENPELPGDN